MRIYISHTNFSVLAIACLCSCSELQQIIMHGIELTPEELLFLSSTFERISSGELMLETGNTNGGELELVSAVGLFS